MAFFGKTNIAEQLSFRYNGSGKVVERFWSFCDLPQDNAENISANVVSCLNSIFLGVHDKQKNLLINVMMVPQY